MTMMHTNAGTNLRASVFDFCTFVARGDVDAARLALDGARHTTPPSVFIELVVVPALRLLGGQCHRGTANPEQVHDAIELVTSAIDHLAPSAPPVRHGSAPIAIACVPGEWHELPARIVATEL